MSARILIVDKDYQVPPWDGTVTPAPQPITITPQSNQMRFNGRSDATPSGFVRHDALAAFRLYFPGGAAAGVQLFGATNFTSERNDLARTLLSVEANAALFAVYPFTATGIEQGFTLPAIPAGTTLDVFEPWQQRPFEQGDVEFGQLTKVVLPAGTPYSLPAWNKTAEGIVGSLNSRAGGAGSTNPARYAWPRQVGRLRGSDAFCYQYASASIVEQWGTPAKITAWVAGAVSRLSSYAKPWLFLQDSRNDTNQTPAYITSLYQAVLTEVHSQLPLCRVGIITSLPLADGSESPFVAAEAAAIDGFESFAKVFYSANAVSPADLSDGNHLGDGGETKLAAYISQEMDATGAIQFGGRCTMDLDGNGAAKAVLRISSETPGLEYRLNGGAWQASPDLNIRTIGLGDYPVSVRRASDQGGLSTRVMHVPSVIWCKDVAIRTNGDFAASLATASEAPFKSLSPYNEQTGTNNPADYVEFDVNNTWELYAKIQPNIGHLRLTRVGQPERSGVINIATGNTFAPNIGLQYSYAWQPGDTPETIRISSADITFLFGYLFQY